MNERGNKFAPLTFHILAGATWIDRSGEHSLVAAELQNASYTNKLTSCVSVAFFEMLRVKNDGTDIDIIRSSDTLQLSRLPINFFFNSQRSANSENAVTLAPNKSWFSYSFWQINIAFSLRQSLYIKAIYTLLSQDAKSRRKFATKY